MEMRKSHVFPTVLPIAHYDLLTNLKLNYSTM